MSNPLFPAIIVNGETIPSAAIAAEAQNHSAPKGKPGLAWRQAAQALVVRTLLLQQARSKHVTATPKEIAPGKIETDGEALIRTLLEQVIDPAQPNEAELRARYDAHPEQFCAPTLFEAAHILFAAAPDDAPAREKAMQKARATLDLLVQTPGQFARIAKDNSDCGSRDSGGALGQLASGDTVPEFEAALLTLNEGEIASAPVETRYGVHVIRLDARADGAQLPFESVRDTITEAYEKVAWAKAAKAYLDDLLADAKVEGIDLKPVVVA